MIVAEMVTSTVDEEGKLNFEVFIVVDHIKLISGYFGQVQVHVIMKMLLNSAQSSFIFTLLASETVK